MSGAWRITENEKSGTRSHGLVTFTMTSPTTFIGSGTETDTYANGTPSKSYSFNVVDGTFLDNGRITWVCESAELSWKWRPWVLPAANGLTMTGLVSAASDSGSENTSGTGTYTRVLPNQ